MIRLLQEIKDRLRSLGIAVSSEPGNADEAIINFSMDKVTNHIKNQTNLNKIPEGLFEIAVDKVVGEFLYLKKSMGQLDVSTLNFDLVAKQVQDGDTSVTFVVNDNSTPEGQFNILIDSLRNSETDYAKYRVLTW